jgi:putative ABC transport system permease protein
VVRKFPGIFFGGPEGFEKYWRRKNITLAHAQRLEAKATLPRCVGIETMFWGGQIETRYKKSPPTAQLFGETPGSFPARDWTLKEGRLLLDVDVENNRDVCVLGNSLATNIFPFGSPVGERLKINGINYSVVGVLEPKGGSLGGNQDNFAVVPVTTGMNRFGFRPGAA